MTKTNRQYVVEMATESGWELDAPLDDNRDSFHHYEQGVMPQLAVFHWDQEGERCTGIFFDDKPVTSEYIREDGSLDSYSLAFGLAIRLARS
jgi:hypothetical protein